MRLLHSGPHSAVYQKDDVAIKIVPRPQNEPHDVLREIKILSTLRYAHLKEDVELVMPFYPLPLSTLLDAQDFTPRTPTFDQACRSLVQQMLLAVAHIHEHDIAHRDICPSNFAISSDGTLVLLDFGIALDRASTHTRDNCTDVGTSAYRSLELVYGDQQYDLRALDLWALGCTIAELFTPFIDLNAKTDSDDESEEELGGFRPPWMQAKGQRAPKWRRKTLFEGRYGDITLAGSVYKILGTATRESWPESERIPSFSGLPFHDFPAQPLANFLPNLPSTDVVGLLDQLLVISASRRTPAATLLQHRWLANQPTDRSRLFETWLK